MMCSRTRLTLVPRVLFAAAKDVELRSAVSELETHLRNTLSSLSDWKLRATTSEVRDAIYESAVTSSCGLTHTHLPPQSRLDDLKNDAGRSQALEREVREKNLLIGKLRHESQSRLRTSSFAVYPKTLTRSYLTLCRLSQL